MIIATHQVKDLESMIDHVVILDGHKILANKNVSQIEEELKNSKYSEVFLTGNGALNIEKFYEKTLTEN
jgi:ABC-type multidrug transport system ATPase subunit